MRVVVLSSALLAILSFKAFEPLTVEWSAQVQQKRAASRAPSLLRDSPTIYPPVIGAVFTSGFGNRADPITRRATFHKGIDLAAPTGTPIRSVASGRILFAGRHAGYGDLVVVDHGKGITSHYGHCSEILVRTGDEVSGGELIAKVGLTGRATGPHLHFELRNRGIPLRLE